MSIGWLWVLGLSTGLHAASWGAFKDSPFEGFRWLSYLRSIAVGWVAAGAVAATGRAIGSEPVVLIGLLYAMERLSTEWWKTFVRHDDQSAYSIPMRLGYQGRPVDNRAIRYVMASLVVVGLIAVGKFVSNFEPLLRHSVWGAPIIIGGFGGWLTAVGGAWKDAPIEGFNGLKFLRSPIVATGWAVPLAMMTQDLVVLTLSAGGFAVASIETYKTFLTEGRAPGKFATKPARFDYPILRHVFAAVHIVLWASLAVTVITKMGASHELFGWPDVTSMFSTVVPLGIVATVSASAAGLALWSRIRLVTSGRQRCVR